jgi:hypothetical protein
MPCPPRRLPRRQLELFTESMSPPVDGAPTWTTLPDQTRRTLTGLFTRMLIAHAAVAAPEPEGDGDDL